MLPDFGWTELLVISIVLIVVIGPKDLPRILRGFGNTMSSVRRMAGDFRKQFDEALKEAELDDVRKLADDVRSLDPRRQIKDALNPLSEPLEEIGRDIDADMKRAMGDSKLPELPKSAPQMGLEQAGARARAAQAAKTAGGKTTKPAAKSTAGAGETAAPAASATAVKAPATARARSKTAKGGASEKPARGGKTSSKANGTASKPATRTAAAKPSSAKSGKTSSAKAASSRSESSKAASSKTASAKTRKARTAKAAADDSSGGGTPS